MASSQFAQPANTETKFVYKPGLEDVKNGLKEKLSELEENMIVCGENIEKREAELKSLNETNERMRNDWMSIKNALAVFEDGTSNPKQEEPEPTPINLTTSRDPMKELSIVPLKRESRASRSSITARSPPIYDVVRRFSDIFNSEDSEDSDDDGGLVVQAALQKSFDQAFSIQNGVLASAGILKDVPLELMHWQNFEESDQWDPKWTKMREMMDNMLKRSDGHVVYDAFCAGAFPCHPNQMIHKDYLPEKGLLVSERGAHALAKYLLALQALKNEGQMTMDPLAWFLWSLARKVHQLEGESKKEKRTWGVLSLIQKIGYQGHGKYSDNVVAKACALGRRAASRAASKEKEAKFEVREVRTGEKRGADDISGSF